MISLVKNLALLVIMLIRIAYELIMMYGKRALGYTLVVSGMIALAFLIPWIIILYVLALGMKLVKD